MHNVFHISQLKKCLRVPEEQLPLDELNVEDDLTYTEYPTRIMETVEMITRNKVIKMCKVQWSHHSEDEATWERDDELKAEFPQLFSNPSESPGSFFDASRFDHAPIRPDSAPGRAPPCSPEPAAVSPHRRPSSGVSQGPRTVQLDSPRRARASRLLRAIFGFPEPRIG